MKLSVLSGQVDLGNNSSFFNDVKQSLKCIKVSIFLQKVSKVEGIPKHLLTLKSLDFPELLTKDLATHVVVGVQHGRCATINLELELKEEQDRMSSLAELRTLAAKVASPEKRSYTNKELDYFKNTRWNIHANSPKNPSSAEEVENFCKDFAESCIESEEPTMIWLVPLAEILPKLDKPFSTTNTLIEKCIKQVDFLSDVIVRISNARVEGFPVFEQKLSIFKKQILDQIHDFKFQIKSKLPLLREGSLTEQEFLKIEGMDSALTQQKIEKWVKHVIEMSLIMKTVLHMTQEVETIQICSAPEETIKMMKLFTFVLVINSGSALKDFDRNDIPPNDTSNKKEIISEAVMNVKTFKKFAEANQDSDVHSFFVTEDDSNTIENSSFSLLSIKRFKNGLQEICPALPSKPENLTIEDISEQSVTISWDEPQQGAENITKYFLKATESSSREATEFSTCCTKEDAMQLKLENLNCGSVYSIVLQGLTNFGLSPVQHLEITTLLAGPPRNLRASFKDNKGVLVEWNQPERKHFGVNVIGFIVRLEAQSEELDNLKEELVQNQEFCEIVFDIIQEKPYFVTVTTLTDRATGYFSKVEVSSDGNSEIFNSALEQMRDAMNLENLKALRSPADLVQIFELLFLLKQDLEFCLKDTFTIIWLQQLMGSEGFKFISNKLTDQRELVECKDFRKCLAGLFFPYSENNIPMELPELETFFAIIKKTEKPSFENGKRMVIRLLEESRNQTIVVSKLKTKLEPILDCLEKIERPSVLAAVRSILHQFGFNFRARAFEHFLDGVIVFGMIEKINFLISNIPNTYTEDEEIEKEILFQFLELGINPKPLFQTYISLKEDICPTKMTNELKNYIPNWKEGEITRVLRSICSNECLDQYFSSEKEKEIKIPDAILLPKPNFTKDNTKRFLENNFTQNETSFKLSREKVFAVDIFQSPNVEKTETEKYLKFLKQLLSLDFHCRDQKSTEKREKDKSVSPLECNDEDDFFSQVVKSSVKPKTSTSGTSSADLVQKTIAICDEFLIQDVIEKMTACQLAIPILCPKDQKLQFKLWATRTVKKKWVTNLPGQDSQVHDSFITSRKMGTISFCRIGNTHLSKSKLTNLFMSSAQGWPEHSYFLHRDMDSKSKLNRGCIEASWYCPEGRPREHLKEINCIYNLRGDAREHKEQFKFILGVSSVVIILMDNTNLEKEEINLIKTMEGHVIIVDLAKEGAPKTIGQKIWLYTLNMNPKALSELLIENIPAISQKSFSLEDQANFAASLGMEVDENNEECQIGKQAAHEFVAQLSLYDINCLKNSVVPLQGYHWQEWGKLDKEESRHQYRSDTNPQKYSSDLRDKKKQMRKKQFKEGVSSEMKFFLEKMFLFGNSKVQKYFIQWCQMGLNELSEKYLPLILKDYNNSSKELSKLTKQLEATKNQNEDKNDLQFALNQSLIDEEKRKLKELSKQFTVASFGIEHLFRELSQIYESYENEDQRKSVSHLPKLAADLFIMGYPLEIMDGDASHVPLTWIKQVLSDVKRKLGKDISVFVLSILGIQSSGKSTLLNTMFGSKFAVSSGRCTKGVFLQLLPVSNNLRQKLNCDYFIIMDSEGLRSPELSDSFRHDNEIATLVACLANTTVINFWGQTFSKDMSDIMQIAAHAYIRMKEVKIKSSFHMIFAGVPDITAEERNRLGVGKILEELNNMILKIAKDEGRLDIFSGLSSIFPLIQEQLDQITIPEFLPALWQGSMSPPESRYGEIVQQLKDSLCFGLMQHQNQTLRTQPLSEFVNRLSDIWEAIKQENFIFGFKNSQAIEVFGELQKLYDKELAQLRKTFFEHGYQIAEKSLSEASELKDEHEGFRRYCRKMDEIIQPQLDTWQEKIVEKLRAHIMQMQDPEAASTHLSTFSFDLKKKMLTWMDKEKMSTKDKIFAICKKEKTAPMKRQQYKKKCLLKAREVARQLRDGNATLEMNIIQDAFDDIFHQWIQESQHEDAEAMNAFANLFSELWFNSVNNLNEKLKLFNPKNNAELSRDIQKQFQIIKDVDPNDQSLFIFPFSPEKDLSSTSNFVTRTVKRLLQLDKSSEQAKKKKNSIVRKVKDIFNDCQRKSISHFSCTAVIAEILDVTYEGLLGPAADDFEFSKTYKKAFLIQIFGVAIKKMSAFQLEHYQKNTIAAYLQSEKQNLFQEFENECQTADSDARAGMRFVNNILIPIIVEQVKLTVGSSVFDSMLAKQEFSQKNTMMYHILKELLSSPFPDVNSYISDYKGHVKKWICKQVKVYFSSVLHLKNSQFTKSKCCTM